MINLANVDLPLPLPPTTNVIWPGSNTTSNGPSWKPGPLPGGGRGGMRRAPGPPGPLGCPCGPGRPNGRGGMLEPSGEDGANSPWYV